jgi:hypothetical protein
MPVRIIQGYSASLTYPVANSLDRSDCLMLSRAIMPVVPAWSIEKHTDPDGEVNLLIIPPDADDAIGPTLIIYKTASGFHVDEFRWDEYRSHGEYFDRDDVLTAIRGTLLSALTMPGSATTMH